MPITRRSLLISTATASFGAVATGLSSPLQAQELNPALGPVIDLPATGTSVMWQRGEDLILVQRLTTQRRDALIALAAPLRDPALNSEGAPRPATAQNLLMGETQDILILSVYCTYLPCLVFLDFGSLAPPDGFYCACHGSIYDGLGRIISGPAERNLYAPTVQLLSDDRVEHMGRMTL